MRRDFVPPLPPLSPRPNLHRYRLRLRQTRGAKWRRCSRCQRLPPTLEEFLVSYFLSLWGISYLVYLAAHALGWSRQESHFNGPSRRRVRHGQSIAEYKLRIARKRLTLVEFRLTARGNKKAAGKESKRPNSAAAVTPVLSSSSCGAGSHPRKCCRKAEARAKRAAAELKGSR